MFIFGRRQEALDEAVKLIGANITAIQADASKLALSFRPMRPAGAGPEAAVARKIQEARDYR